MKARNFMSDGEANDAATALRNDLAQGDALLARVVPIVEHLLAAPDHSLFSDELIARIRGMCHHLSWQILRLQAGATGEAGSEIFADRHGEALAENFCASPIVLSHCHALALEWQLTARMEEQFGIDPVLSPKLQQLIASPDGGLASAAMSALAAQARFAQSQRRMELPLAELPGDLFHELLVRWRSFNGDRQSDAIIRAESKLRNTYDEGASRLSLLSRLVASMPDEMTDALDMERSGVAVFLSALAFRSGQSRSITVFSTHERQIARLALGLRAGGLGAAHVNEQILRLHPQAAPYAGLDQLSAGDAARLLTESGTMGIV